jgi:hypothetical protein
LVDAAQGSSEDDLAILRCCVGLFFFGVPNRGLNNKNMLSLVKGKRNKPFVRDLMEGSALLRDLDVAFQCSFKKELASCFVASFFETRDTPTVEVCTTYPAHAKPLLTCFQENTRWWMEAIR